MGQEPEMQTCSVNTERASEGRAGPDRTGPQKPPLPSGRGSERKRWVPPAPRGPVPPCPQERPTPTLLRGHGKTCLVRRGELEFSELAEAFLHDRIT